MDCKKEYERWLSDPVFDEETRKELKTLTDEEEIRDRFYKSLSFGTGGLRGVIGNGTNRMNVYTVGKATQGLANFINSRGNDGSVAIAFDSRRMSPEFARDTACILAANSIKAYLFESLRPTPELSFAVRELRATAGIVITASHNPPQYNGYKVYWSDGGQIVPPYDKLIIDEVNKVEFADIKRISEEEAVKRGLLVRIGKAIDDKYIAAIKSTILNPEAIKKVSSDIKIVYTPLNGTGYMPVTRVLKELGFDKVYTVNEQSSPDGNFPTLKYPNPEDPAAFTYALRLAKEVDADIALATDPDADRLGVYALDEKSGEYLPFTGNMSGLLICEYELSQKRKKGLLPANGAIVTTIVSSDMAKAVGREYGLAVIETLTGFKYIGEQIKLFEENKEHTFLFGYEESYGCLVGTHARDKDAVVAVTKLCEAAAYYKTQGKTLCDQMREIYKKYGYYKEDLKSVTINGAFGAKKIGEIVERLRTKTPARIGDLSVLAFRDYKTGIRREADGKESMLTLPKSNVLYFELEENGWCCVRPSGTEPKIKFYFGVKGADEEDANKKLSSLKSALVALAGVTE